MAEDNAIKVEASEKLKEFICDNFEDEQDIPINMKSVFGHDNLRKRGGKAALSTTVGRVTSPCILSLQDLSWLKKRTRQLQEEGDGSSVIYLHSLLEGCNIILPEPPVIPRNPELEARVQRLKKEQEAREYQAMTKNVDSVRIREPDDSLAFQMKMLNSHLIAVLQFVVSVGAGFTFGFIGIELFVGSLDFGFRLLLGVACALTIALAEIYFLAKKLSEEYDVPSRQSSSSNGRTRELPNMVPVKQHND